MWVRATALVAVQGNRHSDAVFCELPKIQGAEMAQNIEIFFSFAHTDEKLMNRVRQQLVIHERNGRITKWHDRMIPAGDEWKKHIDARLQRAKIILLFISPAFIDSRYCYEVEGKVALQRHRSGKARVVPVILRPCAWQEAPFGKLQAVPRDGRAIATFKNRDEACLNAATEIMKVVDELVSADSEKSRMSIGKRDSMKRSSSTAKGKQPKRSV